MSKITEEIRRKEIAVKVSAVFKHHGKILLKMGTGAGKTKLALDLAVASGETWITLVPRTPLFKTWKDEINKWYPVLETIHIFPWIQCYASAHKLVPATPEGHNIILDEAHRVTERTWPFIKAMLGTKGKLICLSATVPYKKKDLLQELGIFAEHTVNYSLDSAVEDNLVSDYKIQIIQFPLDNTRKQIQAGRQGAYFNVTEEQGYQFVDKKARQAMYSGRPDSVKWAMLARMRFIYNLPSKLELAAEVLKHIPTDKKVIIFCGSIAHANAVCKHRYHSKTTDKDYIAFNEGKIHQLAVVNTVAEGVNIPNIDYAVLMQVQNEDLHTIQRIGRSLRKTDDPNKCSKIIIFEATGTQDSKWVTSAIQSFDSTKVDFVSASQLYSKGLSI